MSERPYYVVETSGYDGAQGGHARSHWGNPSVEVHVVGPFGRHYLNETVRARGRTASTYEAEVTHLRARAASLAAILNAEARA